MAHMAGQSRFQTSLFPEVLDDVIPADHPVRVIDAFVDVLDLARLGFARVVAEETGRPPYRPGDHLKLYLYGYTNQMRSSRRLEREAERNVEVMWLINRLSPSFKTIADFRKDHGPAIVAACRAFVAFCRDQALVGGEVVAIDGTKLAAAASPKRVITPARLAKQMAALEGRIAAYLAAMDEADRSEAGEERADLDVGAALAALKARRLELQHQAEALVGEGLKQKVVGEPEARLMRSGGGAQVAYNGQIAVDAAHHLIVAFDLTNEGNDRQQLAPMAAQAKAALGVEDLMVLADSGYSNGEHGEVCAAAGITAIVPRPETVNPKGKQYFSRDRFGYDRASDSWRCPAGQSLTCRKVSRTQHKRDYWCDACGGCALKGQCTAAGKRVIVRDDYEDARQAMHQRAAADRQWMKLRRDMAEHPFGTIKWLMGHPRFLVRGLVKAKTEFALAVLSYNLKRAVASLGVPALLTALKPCQA